MINFLASNINVTMIVVWAIIIVATLVVEFETADLVSIWFTVGAFAGLVANILGVKEWIQILLFVGVSLIFVIGTRPFVKKMSENQTIATNSDRLIGKTAVVTKDILENEKGEVKVEYQKWPAISKNNETFKEGEKVLVKEITGNKLVVEEIKEIELN